MFVIELNRRRRMTPIALHVQYAYVYMILN